MVNKLKVLIAYGCLVLLSTACSHNQPVALYLLDAELVAPAASNPALANSHLAIGLGPIHLPDYLNRPQILQQVGENEYQLDEQHRWGEHLELNIARSLAQFLSKRLGVEQIIRYPWAAKQSIDYQVSLDIFKYHQTNAHESLLEAQWQLKQHDQVLLTKAFNCHLPSTAEINALVKNQSICLGQLGLAIEAGVRQFEK